MEFGDNLARLRKKAGFKTPKAFAQHIGIPYTSYRSYEKGAWPSMENLLAIADALHVSIDELLGHTINLYSQSLHRLKEIGYTVTENGDEITLDAGNNDSLTSQTISKEDLVFLFDFVEKEVSVLADVDRSELLAMYLAFEGYSSNKARKREFSNFVKTKTIRPRLPEPEYLAHKSTKNLKAAFFTEFLNQKQSQKIEKQTAEIIAKQLAFLDKNDERSADNE